MGFGDSPYGLGPFGGLSVVSSISVVAAWATSTHGVRVVLSDEPRHSDEFAVGDALNPLTWTLVNDATSTAVTVIAAAMGDDSDTVDLTTLDALGDDLEQHTVTAVGLFSIGGNELADPVSAQFPGVVATKDRVDSVRVNFRDRDLANPPFQVSRGLGHAGTLSIGADGDFATDTGPALTRKLVLRRLNTIRGAFRHLPDYGVGFLEKEPVSGGGDMLGRMREIERQAEQEPTVANAEAHGSIDRNGILIIRLSYEEIGGGTVQMRMTQRAGQIVGA